MRARHRIALVGLDDGSRTLLHTEPISREALEEGRFAATTAIEALSDGSILLGTPNGLSLLAADGTELDRIPSSDPIPGISRGFRSCAVHAPRRGPEPSAWSRSAERAMVSWCG